MAPVRAPGTAHAGVAVGRRAGSRQAPAHLAQAAAFSAKRLRSFSPALVGSPDAAEPQAAARSLAARRRWSVGRRHYSPRPSLRRRGLMAWATVTRRCPRRRAGPPAGPGSGIFREADPTRRLRA